MIRPDFSGAGTNESCQAPPIRNRIPTVKHFKKLNVASAISFALLSHQAHAVVQIKDDVSLSDQEYTEALQWTPGAEGNALQLDKVTVDAGVKGHAGVLVYDTNKNDISIGNSSLTGGENGYGLRVDNATDSNIVVDNTNLSGSGNGHAVLLKNMTDSALTLTGNTVTVDKGQGVGVYKATGSDILIQDTEIKTGEGGLGYSSNTLSGSHLTVKDSNLTGGKLGVSVSNATDGTSISLANTEVNSSGTGVGITTLNDSGLTVTDSTLSGDIYGLNLTNAGHATVSVTGGKITGAGRNGRAINMQNVANSNLAVKDSILTGGLLGVAVSKATDGTVISLDNTEVQGSESGVGITDLNDSALTLTDSTLSGDINGLNLTNASHATVSVTGGKISGGNKGLLGSFNDNSSLTISGSTLSGERNGLRADVNDSKIAIDSSEFTGIFGINVYGHDSDIRMNNSRTSGIYLAGNNIQADIAGSDIGALEINGSRDSEAALGNNTVNVESSRLNKVGILFGARTLGSNTVNLVNSEIIAETEAENAIYIQDTHDNTVNVKDSVIKGDITNVARYTDGHKDSNNVVNLDNSYFEGAVLTENQNPDGSPSTDLPRPGGTINMGNNTTWVAKGKSNAENINITDSTVDISDATVGADNWTSTNTDVLLNGNSQLNISNGKGDMNMVIKSDGKELESLGKEIVTIGKGDMDIHSEVADIGAYKYQLVQNKEGKWVLEQVGGTGGEGGTGGQVVLSNSANAVLSGMAASLASWNSQTGAIYERLNSRLAEEGGSVWGTYYGSEWAGKAGLGSTFNQKINGLAIGADKTLQLNGAIATVGAAVMHDDNHLSDFDEKGSGGSMNSTALQVYGKASLENGLFFKGTASAGRSSSKLQVRSSDGAMAKGDFKQTVFGLTGQAGYRYQVTEEVYVAPFVQMNGYTASGENFSMSNGMDVKSNRYWSARGEAGVEAGVATTVGGIAVTPHVMLSAGHEFVKNNDVGLNGRTFNNTVDGSGYKVAAGVEARVTNNLSAGVNVSYSNSQDVEQRLGITAGMRYSF